MNNNPHIENSFFVGKYQKKKKNLFDFKSDYFWETTLKTDKQIIYFIFLKNR